MNTFFRTVVRAGRGPFSFARPFQVLFYQPFLEPDLRPQPFALPRMTSTASCALPGVLLFPPGVHLFFSCHDHLHPVLLSCPDRLKQRCSLPAASSAVSPPPSRFLMPQPFETLSYFFSGSNRGGYPDTPLLSFFAMAHCAAAFFPQGETLFRQLASR